MNLFKKLLLGAALASTLFVTLPAQQAKAGNITLSPPAKQFWYGSDGTSWSYNDPASPFSDHYLHSQSNLIKGTAVNTQVSYLQFLINDPLSIFANPVTMAGGQLSLYLKDVAPYNPALTGTGILSIYRVSDSAVYNAVGSVPVAGNEIAPIALGQLLAVKPVDNSTYDDKIITFDFSDPVHSSIVNGNPYLSFAIVATTSPDTESILALEYSGMQTLLVTPAPEPISAAYMLIGCGVFAVRRARKLLERA